MMTERWVSNALRYESLQLQRQLRLIGLQQQKELTRVRLAKQELTRTLDHFKEFGLPNLSVLTQPGTNHNRPLCPGGHLPLHWCCPNRIVCSSCNLRLRLMDTMTRRFTPSLWTMYCNDLPPSSSGDTQYSVYHMPSFVKRRNLSTMNTLGYLPFL